jgi:O-antigen/teichoic acid export membrane protein
MTSILSPLRRNAVLNTLGPFVNAACGFVVLPFLVSRLGRETYGFWTLIVATTGYFLVLDFGVSAAIGRLVAAHHAKADLKATNAVVSTATALLLAVCAVVILFSLFVAIPFFFLFDVPQAHHADVAHALLVMSIAAGFYFPALVPYGVLWGYERFDLINAVDIPVVICRAGLTLALIDSTSSLSALAYIVAGVSMAGYVVRALLCWRMERGISVRPAYFSRTVAAEMLTFGSWFSLLGFSRSILPSVCSFIIGHTLGPVAVTTFAIPRLLVAYMSWIAVSATQVVAPKAAVYHFTDDAESQRELFIKGGTYAWALSLFFVGGALLLGRPLLDLWQSSPQPFEYRILVILIVGEAIPLSQWITYNAIVGIGKHRRLAIFGFVEVASIVVAGSLVARQGGLEAIAICVALAGLLFRGLLQMDYGRRLIGVPLAAYLRDVILRPSLIALWPLAGTAVLRFLLPPRMWPLLIVEIGLYCVAYWGWMWWRLHAATPLSFGGLPASGTERQSPSL